MGVPEYYNDHDEVNSYLKSVISLIGKHKIPANLINIHLLYEYVMGNNQLLIKELDNLFSNPQKHTADIAEGLYRNHIWDDDKRSYEQLNNTLSEYFTNILSSAQKASIDTSQTSQNLEKHSNALERDDRPEKIKDIFKDIIQETKKALTINQGFERELNIQKNELKRVKEELAQTKKLAEIDPLTALKNRRSFELSLKGDMNEAIDSKEPLGLIMLDIDFFKKINDKYGHINGDKVIRFVAKTLSDNIKGQDTAARIGGEEYAILLPKTNLEKTKLFAENLRGIIEKSKLIIPSTNEKLDQITVSVGVTIFKPGEDEEKFIDRGDRALYMSKQNGRNKVSSL